MQRVHETEDRCSHQIEREALALLNQGPCKQTHLMFEVRLNAADVKRYRNYLVASGYAKLEQTTEKRYVLRITDKGRQRLRILQEAV